MREAAVCNAKGASGPGLAEKEPPQVEQVDAQIDQRAASGAGFVDEPAGTDRNASRAHPASARVIDVAGVPLFDRRATCLFRSAEATLKAVKHNLVRLVGGGFDFLRLGGGH